MAVLVVKADGTKEPYSEEKIRASATRVGVPPDIQDEMLADIRSRLYDGIATNEIFQRIKEYLHGRSLPHFAAKYNLKKALSEIGPSGYPFEQYVSLLLEAEGYHCETDKIIQGSCVSHEIDVLAVKNARTWFIEAKFHKNPTMRTDVKVTLYIHARYEDIKDAWKEGETGSWIVTNTRFSSDAISYARCRDIRITSWGYPKGEGIMDLIERTGLHPVTMLEGLSTEDKTRLLAAKVVVCSELFEGDNASLLPAATRESILAQARNVCGSKN